jgi:hypothetical protein
MIFGKRGKSEMTHEEVTTLLSNLKLPISLVFTPTNLESEKKKFLNSDTYNPFFEYEVVSNRNSEIFKELASLEVVSDVDPRISDFYLELIESKKSTNELMHSVGNNRRVTELSIDKYGLPSPILFRNASRVLRGSVKPYSLVKKKKEDREFDYEDIARVFDIAFEELGLDDWSVDTSNKIADNGIKIAVKRKQVLMDPAIKRSSFRLQKALVHEVGTHVLRSHNGELSGIPALKNSNLDSYLDAEEGLASYNEERMGLLTYSELRTKALPTWAIQIGEGMSFRELHGALLASVPKRTAFSIALRVKRGLSDTSEAGIYVKDVVYFRGYKRLKNKLKNDVSLYEKLYSGKIGFKEVKWVDEGLIPRPDIKFDPKVFQKIFKKARI